MSLIKSASDIARLRAGGSRLAAILRQVAAAVRPGVSGLELDQLARDLISAGGDKPSFWHYQPAGAAYPFPAALCVSINSEVVHGIPDRRALRAGDVVSLDLGLCHQDLYTDMAVTVAVGEISAEAERLLAVTEQALKVGIAAAKAGVRMGEVGAAIAAVAKREKLGLVKELGGHGVGHAVHEEPLIPNFGPAKAGPVLQAGMVLALEPMFNLGTGRVIFDADGYLAKTADGSLSAHFEHTILITTGEAEVLTK